MITRPPVIDDRGLGRGKETRVLLTIDRPQGKSEYALMELCSSRGRGDYEAFPLSRVRLDLDEIGRRLQAEGVHRLRRAAGRLAVEWTADGYSALLFESGRVILERVTPPSSARAALIARELLEPPPPMGHRPEAGEGPG